jgi:hypothetical protein
MWPPEIDLFEPFQKAIECTRDFRDPYWARFCDEEVREAYVAQREALFRDTAERSEYSPHALSVAEKRVKSMDAILEWLVCGHGDSLDPDGEIAAVYARLNKEQKQVSILPLTKKIEEWLLERKEDDYLEEAKRKVAEAEAEQKVVEEETDQVAAQITGGKEEGFESFSAEAKPEQKAAETEHFAAEVVATLLAASAAQPAQLAAREMKEKQEAEKSMLEPETNDDDDGRNLREDIANWLLGPQDAKDSTGEFKMMDSTFPAKENQDPSERASDIASKIRFLRNCYPDWVASMKAQNEDDMRRSLETELGKERGATVFACFKWLRDADPKLDPSGEFAYTDGILRDEGQSLEHRARSIGSRLSFSYSTHGPFMLAKTMAIGEHQSEQLCSLYAQYRAERSMRLRRIYCWLENRCLENDPSGEIVMLNTLLTFKADAALADMAQEIEEEMDGLEDRFGSDWINPVLRVTTLCSKKNTDVNAETATSTSKKAQIQKSAQKSEETAAAEEAPTSKKASTNEEAPSTKKTPSKREAPSTKKSPTVTTAPIRGGSPSRKKPPSLAKAPTSTKASKNEEAPTRKMAWTRELESWTSQGSPSTMEPPTSTKVPTSQEASRQKRPSTDEEARARKMARTSDLESWTSEGDPSTKKAPTSPKARASEDAPTRMMAGTRELESSASEGAPPTVEAPTSTNVPTSQEDATNAKASTSKKASRRKQFWTSEEAPTSSKPDNDGNDGRRGQSARPSINKRKSRKRSRGDGQYSKKTKRNRRSAVEITPEGSADDDRVHISPSPPIGGTPVSLASDSRYYGPLDLAGQHAGMLQRQMPARHTVMLPRYSMPADQESFAQLNTGGRSLWLAGDNLRGGKVEWRANPETPLYNSLPPNRPRIPGDYCPSWAGDAHTRSASSSELTSLAESKYY